MTYDYTDAPPVDDLDAPRPGVPSPDATAICISIDRLTQAVNRLADNRTSPTGAQPPPAAVVPGPQPGPPPGAAGPPVASNETQIKRGKAIYAKCMNQNPPANVKAIGEHVTGRTLNGNSQKWDETDQVAVLDSMKSWGWS